MFAPLVYIFFFSRKLMDMDRAHAMLHLGIFAALNGLSLGSIFLVYTSASIVKTFFITASTFGAMSIYGHTTKKDLTAAGSFVYMGLIGLVIASLINIFLRSAATGNSATDGNYVISNALANTFAITDINNTGNVSGGTACYYVSNDGRWVTSFDTLTGATSAQQIIVPGEGILIQNGLYAQMTSISFVTVFYG